MTGWDSQRMPHDASDPQRITIRAALALGQAVYDRRAALGITVAELALRAGMTTDDIRCIEEGSTEPTIALLRRLAAALDADVRITTGDDLGSIGFETHAS
jgi:transcriptional regulator with XRE-family HTH domain